MSALSLITSYESTSDSSDSENADQFQSCDGEVNDRKKEKNFFDLIEDEEDSGSEVIKCSEEEESDSLVNLNNPFRSSDENHIPNVSLPSVFTNPFKNAEEAEKCVLEKHVKLAPKLEDVKVINGRKICWNYRKGRCRFGSSCIFAHDSELQLPETSRPLLGSTSGIKRSKKLDSDYEKPNLPSPQGVPAKKVMNFVIK